jgi:hypothetical protein
MLEIWKKCESPSVETSPEVKMTNLAKLDVCTKEQLEELLAGLLEHACGQTLNDVEVQEFWQVYQEMERRSTRAA